MAELLNNFSWSHSRAKMCHECLRQYYWNYYGSWNGWRQEAPAQARLAYRLKQIQTLAIWAGDITHRVIEHYLRAVRAGQRPRAPDALQEEARQCLNIEWAQSVRREWERNPKRCVNLFEHYYGQPISREQRAELREHIFNCLDRFEQSDALRRIQAAGASSWIALEDLQQFQVMKIPVWVKLDIAIQEANGLAIFDWKTGQQREDDEEQARTYILFAMSFWQKAPETIQARMIYLRDGAEKAITADAAALINHRETIMDSMKRMLALLADPANNQPLALEEFAMTEDRGKCQRCNFRQICFPQGLTC
ncbi:MAG: PD-(D/E)XK nuclease family protein [Candidatus Sumerlaeota bacterium]|nr:PD-(D/E)XK nuclease family protein [Candidatus Sumerlaeota bacterium]